MKGLRLVSCLAAATVIAACGGSTTTTKVIKLGAILSITGAGGVYGPQSRDGMNLAVKQINAGGGILGANIPPTMNQGERALALLGPTLSNSAVGAHPLAESLKTPILAVSTTGIHIVPDCNWPATTACKYVFRDSLGEETAIPDNIKTYASAAGSSKTGVLLVAQDDKFSSDGGKIVQDTVGQYNISLAATIKFNKGEADLSPYVTQAIQKKPDVIFITSLGGIPATIMTEARKQRSEEH